MAADADATFILWRTEIERAVKRGDKWRIRGRKIIKRYRDERNDGSDGLKAGRRRFNILWSNVQTLLPSLYARKPEPIVERRFLDKDPIGRVASTILERSVKYEIEDNGFHEAVQAAVLDYLLPGQAQVWVRFEAPAEEPLSPEQEGGSPYDDSADQRDGASDQEGYPAQMGLDQTLECVPVDYVHWEDFLTSDARVWSEVTWVARRVWMGRSELVKRWPKVGRDIPLERPRDASGRFLRGGEGEEIRKAEIFEIWCKETKKVKFIAKAWDRMIEEVDDPLHLRDFWPCPRPLRATTTHDTLEPVPDYAEYQDQAEELDQLTARITSLTKSLRVAGAYDASAPGLQRLLDEGIENKLVPVENWAAFAEKGGLDGAITWLPIKDVAAVLVQLFEARERIKQDLYEITGIADIIRGQSDPRETLGAQQLKGGFATQRLSARQVEVARFARDVIRIVAEIIAEHWSPQTLVMASSVLQDDGLFATPQMPEAPSPPTGPSTGGEPLPEAPAIDPMTMRMQMVGQAIELLRNDKLRGFRVDIETDSTIQNDAQQEKQARVEFVTAVGGLLQQAIAGSMQFPPVAELAGNVLQWTIRGFRVGRDLEGAVEDFIEKAGQFAQQAAANPQQSPEAIKAAAEQQKQMLELQRQQVQDAHDKEMKQLEIQSKALEFRAREAQAVRDEQIANAEHQRKMAEISMGVLATQAQTDARIAVARASKREAQ